MLYSVTVVVLWTVISLAVVIYMAKLTNRYIAEETERKDIYSIELPKPYGKSVKSYVVLFLLSVISALCAFFVEKSVISVFFCIEMGFCYIAVLGSAVADIKLNKIPNILPIGLFVSGIIMITLQSFFIDESVLYFISSFIGCLLSFCILTVSGKIAKNGIGKGDVKLVSAIGLTVGVQAVFVLMTTSLLICLAVMIGLRVKEKYIDKNENVNDSQNKLAFAPFLYLGFVIMSIGSIY